VRLDARSVAVPRGTQGHIFIVFSVLVIDLICARIDPRISYE